MSPYLYTLLNIYIILNIFRHDSTFTIMSTNWNLSIPPPFINHIIVKYVVSVKRFTKITKSKYPFQRFPYNFAMNIKHKGGRDFNRMTEMVLVTLMARENGKKHLGHLHGWECRDDSAFHRRVDLHDIKIIPHRYFHDSQRITALPWRGVVDKQRRNGTVGAGWEPVACHDGRGVSATFFLSKATPS